MIGSRPASGGWDEEWRRRGWSARAERLGTRRGSTDQSGHGAQAGPARGGRKSRTQGVHPRPANARKRGTIAARKHLVAAGPRGARRGHASLILEGGLGVTVGVGIDRQEFRFAARASTRRSGEGKIEPQWHATPTVRGREGVERGEPRRPAPSLGTVFEVGQGIVCQHENRAPAAFTPPPPPSVRGSR